MKRLPCMHVPQSGTKTRKTASRAHLQEVGADRHQLRYNLRMEAGRQPAAVSELLNIQLSLTSNTGVVEAHLERGNGVNEQPATSQHPLLCRVQR